MPSCDYFMLTDLPIHGSTCYCNDFSTDLLMAGEAWATPAKTALEPVLNLGSLAFLIRIVMSWYPQVCCLI